MSEDAQKVIILRFGGRTRNANLLTLLYRLLVELSILFNVERRAREGINDDDHVGNAGESLRNFVIAMVVGST
jgi:hypothetical protein